MKLPLRSSSGQRCWSRGRGALSMSGIDMNSARSQVATRLAAFGALVGAAGAALILVGTLIGNVANLVLGLVGLAVAVAGG